MVGGTKLVNEFRTMIQTELTKIQGLEPGKIISDDVIQEGVYHFGYEVSTSVVMSSLDYSDDTMILNVTGYLTTKGGSLADFDNYTDQICTALSNLRIKASTRDITTYDQTRKTVITGSVYLNTLTKMLR